MPLPSASKAVSLIHDSTFSSSSIRPASLVITADFCINGDWSLGNVNTHARPLSSCLRLTFIDIQHHRLCHLANVCRSYMPGRDRRSLNAALHRSLHRTRIHWLDMFSLEFVALSLSVSGDVCLKTTLSVVVTLTSPARAIVAPLLAAYFSHLKKIILFLLCFIIYFL